MARSILITNYIKTQWVIYIYIMRPKSPALITFIFMKRPSIFPVFWAFFVNLSFFSRYTVLVARRACAWQFIFRTNNSLGLKPIVLLFGHWWTWKRLVDPRGRPAAWLADSREDTLAEACSSPWSCSCIIGTATSRYGSADHLVVFVDGTA